MISGQASPMSSWLMISSRLVIQVANALDVWPISQAISIASRSMPRRMNFCIDEMQS